MAFNSRAAFSAAASSWVLKLRRMRTPLRRPSTRNENTPFRFLNRLTANIGWAFMLRLPRQLDNLASSDLPSVADGYGGQPFALQKAGGEGGIRTAEP